MYQAIYRQAARPKKLQSLFGEEKHHEKIIRKQTTIRKQFCLHMLTRI